MNFRILYVICLILNCAICVISTYSLKNIRNIFTKEWCIEGSWEADILNNIDKTKVESKAEALINLSSVSIVEHGEKPILSLLNELAAHHQIEYYFKLEKEEGAAHQKLFTISLTFGDEIYVGEGSSHKKAKQNAASKVLESNRYEFPKEKKPTVQEIEKMTPTVLLSNIASKLGLPVIYYLLDKEKQEILHSNIVLTKKNKSYFQKLNNSIYNNQNLHIKRNIDTLKGPFRIKLQFGDNVFFTTAHSIQSGRHEVAAQALEFLAKNKDNLNVACLKEGFEDECKKNKEQLKSPISKVYEEAQRRKYDVEFEIIKESGPAHKKTFVTECKFGDLKVTGEGFSKKESKKIAAQNMLEKIQKLEPFLPKNENSYISNISKDKKKKSKKKLIKNKIDEISMTLNNLGKSVLNYATNIFKDEKKDIDHVDPIKKELDTEQKVNRNKDSKFKSDDSRSPEEELLGIANALNFKIAFTNINENNNYGSLLHLRTNPEYTCFGEEKTDLLARNVAAKNGLDLLIKIGIYEVLINEKTVSMDRSIKEETRVILDQIIYNEKDEL